MCGVCVCVCGVHVCIVYSCEIRTSCTCMYNQHTLSTAVAILLHPQSLLKNALACTCELYTNSFLHVHMHVICDVTTISSCIMILAKP